MSEVSERPAITGAREDCRNPGRQPPPRPCESGRHRHSLSPDNPREIKAAADKVMEDAIVEVLAGAALPILSEERGYVASQRPSSYWFVVDPLDGTFNFVKGLGPSAISVALWADQTPIFGVIYSLEERQLFWGGSGLGAFCGTTEASRFPTRRMSRRPPFALDSRSVWRSKARLPCSDSGAPLDLTQRCECWAPQRYRCCMSRRDPPTSIQNRASCYGTLPRELRSCRVLEENT